MYEAEVSGVIVAGLPVSIRSTSYSSSPTTKASFQMSPRFQDQIFHQDVQINFSDVTEP